MFEVEVVHYGQSSCKYYKKQNRAIEVAEDAVYELGAEYSAVRDIDGSTIAEYEL